MACTPPEPMVVRVDLELFVGLALVAEVFGGAWQREFILLTTWHTIPGMSFRVRKVDGWLGSVVAEGVSSVQIKPLFCR